MSLTKEKIVANATKYFATAEKQGFATPELQDFLGLDFVGAPASTQLKYGNAFEGGLVDHILRVMRIAYKINETLESQQVPIASLIKTVYLYQIGKAKMFTPKLSSWHNERGIMYDFNEDLSPMRTGERSIYYCIKAGIELSEDEYVAILNHDKSDDLQAEHHNNDLGTLLVIANKLAINQEKALVNAD